LRVSSHRDRTDIAVPLVRRNYVLSVVNGALWMLGNRTADPGTVIPLLVLRLAGAEWAVGAAQAVQEFGRVMTQVVISRALDSVPRKMPVYILGSVARIAALVGATVVLLTGEQRSPMGILVVLLGCLFVLMVGNGISELAWGDVAARSVPSSRRGGMFMWRRVLGLLLTAAVAAPLVGHFLAPDTHLPFPTNYGMLYLAGTAFLAVSYLAFFFAVEPPAHAARRRLTVRQHFARGLRIVRRDRSYRRLLRQRLLSTAAWAVPAFFVAFAIRGLGMPEKSAAGFILLRTVSEIGASVLVGRVSDRIGNRAVIRFGNAMTLVTFSLAALSALAQQVSGLQGEPAPAAIVLISAAFFFLGLMTAGREVGEYSYMLDIAPAAKRPSYMSFGNFFLLPLSLLPILVGWLAPRAGYLPLFVGAATLALVAIVLDRGLEEPRDRLAPGEAAGS